MRRVYQSQFWVNYKKVSSSAADTKDKISCSLLSWRMAAGCSCNLGHFTTCESRCHWLIPRRSNLNLTLCLLQKSRSKVKIQIFDFFRVIRTVCQAERSFAFSAQSCSNFTILLSFWASPYLAWDVTSEKLFLLTSRGGTPGDKVTQKSFVSSRWD